jgi:hypothetical protein
MYAAVPTRLPVVVIALLSAAREIPKSMTCAPRGGQDHVGRLEIPVHDPGGGQRRQGLPEFHHQPPHAGRLQQPALADGLGEVEAGQVLGGHPQQRVVEPGAQQMRRARCAHPAVHGGLPLEPPPEVRPFGVLGPDHLHGGEPGGVVRAPGQIDPAHAAAAEQPERDVGPDAPGIGGQQRGRARLPQRVTGRRYVCHGPPDLPFRSSTCSHVTPVD